jgi:hypothetical protein
LAPDQLRGQLPAFCAVTTATLAGVATPTIAAGGVTTGGLPALGALPLQPARSSAAAITLTRDLWVRDMGKGVLNV